jgi:hypothetical protein
MIVIQKKENLVNASAIGEFTLKDYKEFESKVLEILSSGKKVNLLFDLRDMLRFTLDVAWEEIKFSRQHTNDFGRVAVVTDDQWLAWSAWLSRIFVNADIQVFDNYDVANTWVS